jgi:hypothetical protein
MTMTIQINTNNAKAKANFSKRDEWYRKEEDLNKRICFV